MLQLFWVGAWVPFWMRLVLMLPLYALAACVLATRATRTVAWERGALPLDRFHIELKPAVVDEPQAAAAPTATPSKFAVTAWT